jgi:hypothetical protein
LTDVCGGMVVPHIILILMRILIRILVLMLILILQGPRVD